jgi:sulfite reductase (NADPH) flavoprotein alpha-component
MQSIYLIAGLSVAWLTLCIVMWRLHRSRLYSKPKADVSTLIAYASQTGNAQTIAKRCAAALNLSETTSVIALNALTLAHLRQIENILFVVSTYGDGEAPDNGALFTKLTKTLSSDTSERLNHLSYSIIALGDSAYPKFCAFGHQINQTMLDAGAQSQGEVITVDNYHEQTTELANITPDWVTIDHELTLNPAIKSLQYWQLTKRELLNPGCSNENLLQLNFKSIGPSPTWKAGDLIDIQPQQPTDIVDQWLLENKFDGNTWVTYQGHQQYLKEWLLTRDLPLSCSYSLDELLNKLPYLQQRSYSVASISQEGQLKLIVRLVEKKEVNYLAINQSDITFGLSSGFLGHYCQVGSIVEGQIREVSSHHNINPNRPKILIGAGSGLAGLKAQIAASTFSEYRPDKASECHQKSKIWLIYGERNSKPELPINQQLLTLQETHLAKLNCAYSQVCQNDLKSTSKNNSTNKHPKYVQEILVAEQNTLQQWIEDGAVIYVCGCLSGMGESVHQALIEILGKSAIEALQLEQRYIRDVY